LWKHLPTLIRRLSLYLKLANRPFSYLLESVQGGERFGRYSFIGLPAETRITVRGTQVTLTTPAGETTQEVANPLDYIEEYQAQFKVAPLSGLPRFTGGLAGYFGYDTVRYIEPRLARNRQKRCHRHAGYFAHAHRATGRDRQSFRQAHFHRLFRSGSRWSIHAKARQRLDAYNAHCASR
jgi:anthranilate/para-aminobenzoate synthase component I